MRLPDNFGQRKAFRFNITPMIDVVFLLIIFFLVASYFVRSEQAREISLPDAAKGEADDQSSQARLTITIEKDGQLSIAGQRLSEAAVARRLQELSASVLKDQQRSVEPEIRIRADREARYAQIRNLIEQCSANGIQQIRFAVNTP